MPKRKLGPVSLAGRGSGPPAGDRVRTGADDATPERLRQARTGGGACVDAQGVRRIAEPFDQLRARNLLDRADVAQNETLWQAGDRLRLHWHRARFDGLATLDLSRPQVDGGGEPGALTPTEAVLRHRTQIRRAAEAVGPRLLPYLRAVVIDAHPLAALHGMVTDTAHARTAEALALERLREALHRLCDHWSMHPNRRPLPIGHWRDPDPAAPRR